MSGDSIWTRLRPLKRRQIPSEPCSYYIIQVVEVMASYIEGYDEKRFVSKFNRNFICQMCSNVVREPVLCPRNQHCFCRSCITKHLENAKRCPTCNDELTEQTLIEAPKMIQIILNEFKIRCVYTPETPELQHLEQHEDTCGFTPAVCTNQGCGTTVNKRDLIHHESEVCEFRKLKCHSCGEMSKTLGHTVLTRLSAAPERAPPSNERRTNYLQMRRLIEAPSESLKT